MRLPPLGVVVFGLPSIHVYVCPSIRASTRHVVCAISLLGIDRRPPNSLLRFATKMNGLCFWYRRSKVKVKGQGQGHKQADVHRALHCVLFMSESFVCSAAVAGG